MNGYKARRNSETNPVEESDVIDILESNTNQEPVTEQQKEFKSLLDAIEKESKGKGKNISIYLNEELYKKLKKAADKKNKSISKLISEILEMVL